MSHVLLRVAPLAAACGRAAPTEVICELLQQKADVNLRTGRSCETHHVKHHVSWLSDDIFPKIDINLAGTVHQIYWSIWPPSFSGGVGLTPLMALALFESRNIYTLEHLALLINAKADIHQPGGKLPPLTEKAR